MFDILSSVVRGSLPRGVAIRSGIVVGGTLNGFNGSAEDFAVGVLQVN